MTVNKILEFKKHHTDILNYLPSLGHDKRPNREWLWNIGTFIKPQTFTLVNTLVSKNFKKLIKKELRDLNEVRMPKREMKLTTLKEFVDIFRHVKTFSSK